MENKEEKLHECDENCVLCPVCYTKTGRDVCADLCGCWKDDLDESENEDGSK
jgi:hypothetical protein